MSIFDNISLFCCWIITLLYTRRSRQFWQAWEHKAMLGLRGLVLCLQPVPEAEPRWGIRGRGRSFAKVKDYFALWKQILTKIGTNILLSLNIIGKNLHMCLNIGTAASRPWDQLLKPFILISKTFVDLATLNCTRH